MGVSEETARKHGANNTIEFLIRAINDNDIAKFYNIAQGYLKELPRRSHYGDRIHFALQDGRKRQLQIQQSKPTNSPVEKLRKCKYTPNGFELCYFHKWFLKKDQHGNEVPYALIEIISTGMVVNERAENIEFTEL